MGGAQGSMMHPYDNMHLKISDWISIARQFTQRKQWSEKIDGVNITWTYRKGVFYIARNKAQLKDPLTFEAYRKSLKGHPAEAQFLKGVDMIESIGRSANQLNILTGKPQKEFVWANTELVDSESPQMMRYDEDCLVVHSIFIQYADDHRYNFPTYTKYFEDVFFPIWNKTTKVYNGKKVSLPPVEFRHFMKFEAKVHSVLAECDLTPQATIADVIHARVYNALSETIHPEHAWQIADNVSQLDKHPIKPIQKAEIAHKSLVDDWALSKNRLKVHNRVLRDLKDAWLHFGAKVLDGSVSTLIHDVQRADDRMKRLITFNSEFVCTLPEMDPNYRGFCLEFQKFSDYDVEPQLIEGIVFTHNGYLYKLTGAFQLQNRITGIARYQYNVKMEED